MLSEAALRLMGLHTHLTRADKARLVPTVPHLTHWTHWTWNHWNHRNRLQAGAADCIYTLLWII